MGELAKHKMHVDDRDIRVDPRAGAQRHRADPRRT